MTQQTPLTIDAQPGPFTLDPTKTALVVIDMQRDFIEPGGFGESLGNDVSLLAEIVPTVAALLAFARRHQWLVVHTRESHAADLSDCPPAKRLRGAPKLKSGAINVLAAGQGLRWRFPHARISPCCFVDGATESWRP